MKNFIKSYTSLLVIIIAALLIELTTGIIYYNSQDIIKRTTVRVMERENIALYLCIRNKLTEVEVVLDNMSWIVTDDLLRLTLKNDIQEIANSAVSRRLSSKK